MGKSILTADQQKLLAIIVQSSEITTQFYLTGGTALSEYYYQHRLSEDFDFFTDQSLKEEQILFWVQQIAKKLKVKEVEYQTLHGQLVFFFNFETSVVKVDFAYYPFHHLGKFKQEAKLKVASVLDIAVNKLQALQTRKRGRDFFDLYVILNKENYQLEYLIQEYSRKFGVKITLQELAKNFIVITETVDQPRFLGKVDWSEVENFFLNISKQIGKGLIQ